MPYDTWFVQQFQNTVLHLYQQKDSRFSGYTTPPVQMVGEKLYWERLGLVEAQDLINPLADTTYQNADQTRRCVSCIPRVINLLISPTYQLRQLVDSRNPYTQAAVSGQKRKHDRIILEAARGYAYTGKDGTTAVALPDGQKIVHGSVGLTLEKLHQIQEILRTAEADPDEPTVLALNAKEEQNLLRTTEVKSADYNTVKALVNGTLGSNTFMGFNFVRSQLVYVASNVAYCLAWKKSAMGGGTLEDVKVRIDELPTKNYSTQIYTRMDLGAVRVIDEGVVEVQCYEA
jgi:hypothetical protein